MAKTILERAKKAYYRKRYEDVITLLEPNVIQYRDSFQFYFYLGMACLQTGDIGGASSYFQRARQIKMRDPDLLVAQAALYLRRGETHQAVEYYLEALEYAPGHRLAKRALDFIRKKGDNETISAFVETGRIKAFYPKLTGKMPLPAAISLACVAAFVIAFVFFGRGLISRMAESRQRADLSSFALDAKEKTNSVSAEGSFRYVLTEREVLASYQDARDYFQDYRDNAAQVEINRLLSSNASLSIKQKARLLMTYLSEPGFDSIKDNYPYSKITADPSLYLDCWIAWKGMATNIDATQNTIAFDFLVGYDTRNKLEGIVPVRFKTFMEIDPERPLELLAKITESGGKLTLEGRSVFQSSTPAVK
jgi:tetratricopeptide (TPR) repeat protein